MAMNPVETTKRIENDYQNYLKSILKIKNEDLTQKAYSALKNNNFIKGPFLEATPPFVSGATLEQLIQEGVACTEFRALEKSAETNRPLYIHQEQSFRKIVSEQRNLIVATGTGSGKTECFLYPIFNELMKEKKAGSLNPGVRALLLYPMNALANDQIKRLRSLLEGYPEITFGRYTGETINSEAKALEVYRAKKEQEFRTQDKIKGIDYTDSDLNPAKNELISRETMRNTPPNILLTNYAMLEYLLLRPDDTTLFDGDLAQNWKFIVLDEAHTYKGANGTEISLLLSRLKERILRGEQKHLQCIATSATLGSSEALPELADFAANIFGEEFKVDDIITSQRKKRVLDHSMVKYSLEQYREMKRKAREIRDDADAGEYLYNSLVKDDRIIGLLNALELKPKEFSKVASLIFSDYESKNEQAEALMLLIELGSRAKQNENSSALIPARYHLFVRALEGFYVSLYPDHKVYLDRKEYIQAGEYKIPVFELANCQSCGQEYIIGKTKDGYLKQPTEGDHLEYYMLTNELMPAEEIDTDSDDEVFEAADVKKVEPFELCTACGKITRAGVKRKHSCCDHPGNNKLIKVLKLSGAHREVNTCASCGAVGSAKIKRFLTANQPATFVIASSLYSMIPPNKITLKKTKSPNDDFFESDEVADKEERDQEFYDESGRKLLVFSDNRQEAAFFAAYMDSKYNQVMWRKLMIRELKNRNEPMYLDDFLQILVKRAKDAGLFPDELTYTDKEILAGIYLMKEFMGFERNQGLENSGYIRFMPEPFPKKLSGRWGFTGDELTDLCYSFMDTLRFNGATSYPENIDPEREEFFPRNRNIYFRGIEGGSFKTSKIISFLPVGGSNNRRIDFLRKILESRGMDRVDSKKEAEEILKSVYDNILTRFGPKGPFEELPAGNNGVLNRLNYKKWKIEYIKSDETVYRCDRCGKSTTHNILNICPEFRCSGKLEEIKAENYRDDPYTTSLYEDEKLLPMISKEHTGQLSKDAAGSTQSKFEAGQINILSCTTTFEMGVDVGQLEAIFLRNVPPETANYVQRAGRAGRRTSSTAFSVTFARRNSHDLSYFQDPAEMISGKIKSPYIETSNEKIAARHVNSIVLAWFFRLNNETRKYFTGKVKAIVGESTETDLVQALTDELKKRPPELMDSIEQVLSPDLMEKLKIKDWDFVDRLIGEDGSLTQAVHDKQDELDFLNEMYTERMAKREYTNDLRMLINTFESQPAINFMASGGVIPKYGFPVDVVNLDVLNNTLDAKSVDLSRDLKLAISEYAPGSEIIAAGKVWTSHSLNRVRDKEWPTYRFYECPECKKTTFPDSLTTLEEKTEELSPVCSCGAMMRAKKMVIPIFGFSTSFVEKPKIVRDSKPRRFYPTKVQFGGFDEMDHFEKQEVREDEVLIGRHIIKAKYAPQGKLVVMNRGAGGGGMFICPFCGFAKTFPNEFRHKNKAGKECFNERAVNASLGHIFRSDVLRLQLPNKTFRELDGKDQWITLLYAILEGASDTLGISRDDINGCIDYSEVDPVLILFDENPGGAGHVKRIYNQLNAVLKAAYQRVDGHCNCGPETSCYGCLRNYSNQLEHDRLSRGLAKEYLEWMLLGKSPTAIDESHAAVEEQQPTETSPQEPSISKEWLNTLKMLMRPEEDLTYRTVLDLIHRGVDQVPDEIGYELTSADYGVLGYEAEMVWKDRKVAFLANEDPVLLPEAVNAFSKDGWKVFTPDADLELLVKELM